MATEKDPNSRKASKKAPWEKKNPKKKAGKPSQKLTPEQKEEAKARAKKAGRPYPNLVDNMAVARKSSGRSSK
jgi:hypothetical protein